MDIFQELRDKIGARARGADTLAGVQVYAQEEKDLKEKIKAQTNEKTGAVVYVFEPLPIDVSLNVNPIVIDKLEIRLRIVANPVIAAQRNLPSVSSITLELLALFNGWDPATDHVNKLFPEDRPVRDVSTAKLTARDVLFWATAIYPLRD